MAKKNNIIEINGKQYDAVSGERLATARPVKGSRQPASATATKKAAPLGAHQIHSKAKPAKTGNRPAKRTVTAGQSVRVMDVSRPGVKQLSGHAQQHSKTLMRTTVHKPAPGLKRHVKAVARTDILAKQPDVKIVPKLSIAHVDAKRLKRASTMAKSQLISRFSDAGVKSRVITEPPTFITEASQPLVSYPASLQTAKPSLDIFEKALMRATAHQQPKHRVKTKHRRGYNIATAALAVILLGGFLAYQNVANLTMSHASAKAGFQASLPGYRPSGFALGNFTYSPGSVAVNFHSNSDDRSFAVIEKVSDWDSQALRDSFLASSAGSDYQAVQVGGRTVYIYKQSNATWVSGGVWYQIQSGGSLSPQQLVKLAASM